MCRVNKQRKAECQEMDCPVIDYCEVHWGRECTKQMGNKVPRFIGGNPYAVVRMRISPTRSESVGQVGRVFWLRRSGQETCERVEE